MEEMNVTEIRQETEPIMSVKDWLLTILVLMIPVVNIIMLFVWAFGDGTVKTKSNFAKAQMIMFLVLIVLSFLLTLLFVSLGVFASGFPSSY